jgi:AraC-like DNA-binding protein
MPPAKPGGAKAAPAQPVRGRAWCIPQNTSDPAGAQEALRALMAPAFAKELELTSDTNFHPLRELWNDGNVLMRRPLYRFAAALFDGPFFAIDNLDEKWRMVEWAFRTALAERASPERFLARLGGIERAPAGKGAKHPIVRQALAHIEKNLDRIEGRNEVAKSLGLTPDHLNRVFAKEMGESAGTYLMRRRLEKAKVLLQEPGTSVKAVAIQLGFKTSSYFSRAYKKHWGISPLNTQRTKGEH